MKKGRSLSVAAVLLFVWSSMAASSLFAQQDPNEPNMLDSKDFKNIQCKYIGGKFNLEFTFYAAPVFTELTMHLINDAGEQYQFTCKPNQIEVRKMTSGIAGNVIFQTNASISGTKYRFNFPPKAVGFAAAVPTKPHHFEYWLLSWLSYVGSDVDRFPDSGKAHLRFDY